MLHLRASLFVFFSTSLVALTTFGWSVVASAAESADAEGWTELAADEAFTAWRSEHKGWSVNADAAVDSSNDKKLSGKPGAGILIGRGGDGTDNLYTRDEFQDVEVKFEFMVPRGSNSGVKLNGLYEVQIRDSHGLKEFDGDVCGGVYPRAEQEPSYHHIDAGIAPRKNAARPVGEWQTLEISFVAARFDAAGKKTSNARFVRVVLNGETVHENADLQWPTGAAWDEATEVPSGPLMFQGDHGPVALRKIMVHSIENQ